MTKKQEQYQTEFWADYEKRYGEKVFSHVLGKYLSGWPGYEYPLWGLLIATGGGLRFHHFPHEGWLQAQIRASSGAESPREKTIFIPRERLLSVELRLEKNWWKKTFSYRPPVLAIQYRREAPQKTEQESTGLLLAETHQTEKSLIAALLDSMGQSPPVDPFPDSDPGPAGYTGQTDFGCLR
jgi:hypothetical protein